MKYPFVLNRLDRPPSLFASVRRALAIASLFCVISLSAQPAPKIATIDLSKVFDGYFKTKQADAYLENHGADAQKVLNGLLEDYKKANDEYRKLTEGANDQAVSAEERDKRKKGAEGKVGEVRELQATIEKYKNDATARIMDTKRRMRDGIVREIRDLIDAKAKAAGYFLVLDTSSKGVSDTPAVLFTNGQNDLTDEILVELNAKAPPGVLESLKKEDKGPVAPPKLDDKPAAAPPAAATPPKKKK